MNITLWLVALALGGIAAVRLVHYDSMPNHATYLAVGTAVGLVLMFVIHKLFEVAFSMFGRREPPSKDQEPPPTRRGSLTRSL